jgi:hypothetical protein
MKTEKMINEKKCKDEGSQKRKFNNNKVTESEGCAE